jgi:GTP-binding protein SAR1
MSSSIYDYWLSLVRSLFTALGLKGKQGTLLVLGLDNAGKTTLLHRLRTGQIRNYPPTDRPSLTEKFSYQGITFNAWDLGGHEAVRHLWSDYAPECKALLFLIDASEAERIEEAGYELDALIGDGIITDIPIAILLNKCDLPDARPSGEVCEKIQYPDLIKMHPPEKMRIFRISVLRGEGYQEAFQWISSFL